MEARETGSQRRSPWPVVVRCALAVPLALVATGYLYVLVRTMLEPGQGSQYYAVNAVITLVPLVVYAVAAAFLVTARGHRVAWLVLLLCGLALTGVALYYALTIGGVGELFLAAPYLSVMSAAELVLLSPAARRRSDESL